LYQYHTYTGVTVYTFYQSNKNGHTQASFMTLVVLYSTSFFSLTFLSYFSSNGRNMISHIGAFGLLNDAAAFLARDE
jgi:hypothetical protein